MSAVLWHTPSADDEATRLSGSERAWLDYVARGPAMSAWDLDGSSRQLERAAEIMAMVPEVPDGEYGANYLWTGHRRALAEAAANKAQFVGQRPPFYNVRTSYDAQKAHIQSLRMRLRDLELMVGQYKLDTSNVGLNTALKMGSDPMKLAAKIHGWCESHCYIEGEDREWAAGIIDQGLDIGVYRKGMWYVDGPHDELTQGPRSQQPGARFISQGWEDVLTLLRSRNDEPVVLSYTVCEGFPDHSDTIEYWDSWPEGVEHSYMKLSPEQQEERGRLSEIWYERPYEEQWVQAMSGLRARKPWARLSPKTLGTVFFHVPVTVYDLLAPDRDERVAKAFAVGEA